MIKFIKELIMILIINTIAKYFADFWLPELKFYVGWFACYIFIILKNEK